MKTTSLIIINIINSYYSLIVIIYPDNFSHNMLSVIPGSVNKRDRIIKSYILKKPQMAKSVT